MVRLLERNLKYSEWNLRFCIFCGFCLLQTPIDMARAKGMWEIVRLLEDFAKVCGCVGKGFVIENPFHFPFIDYLQISFTLSAISLSH